MSKMSSALACATAILVSCQTAMAASPGDSYFGVGYSQLTYSEDGLPDFNPTMLGFRAGYYLNKNFSVEGRFGFGIGDDTVQLTNYPTPFGPFTGDVSVEVDNIIGIYAVGHLPASDNFGIYGFFGFNQADITATATSGGLSYSYSDDDSDMAYGIGIDIKVGQKSSINVEYGNFYDEDNVSVDAITVGFNTSL